MGSIFIPPSLMDERSKNLRQGFTFADFLACNLGSQKILNDYILLTSFAEI